jgi:hypothetical protein
MPRPDPNDSDILSVYSGVHVDHPVVPPIIEVLGGIDEVRSDLDDT